MERPGKGEWYEMQTACEVRRVLSTRPSEHRVNHLKLTFSDDPGEVDELDDAEAEDLEARKRRDMAAFGKGGVYTPPPPREDSGNDSDPETSPEPEEYEEYTGRETSRWEDPLT